MALSDIGDGWKLFKDCFASLARYPALLIPVFMSWCVFAGIVLWERYYFQPPDSVALWLLYIYLMLLAASLAICAGCLLMLEFMQQIERGERTSLGKALGELVGTDLVRMVPIAVLWSVLWFILLILMALTSKKKRGSRSDREPSAQDAARTLGGADGESFSLARLGLRMIEKLLRMTVFLSLPAIAWADKGPFAAIGSALRVIRRHPLHFLTVYSLTGLAALVMGIPLGVVFYLNDHGVAFSSAFWTGVIIYIGTVWTLSMYLEQMTVALLYLWHLKWLRNGATGDLSSVPRPSLLDGVAEFRAPDDGA